MYEQRSIQGLVQCLFGKGQADTGGKTAHGPVNGKVRILGVFQGRPPLGDLNDCDWRIIRILPEDGQSRPFCVNYPLTKGSLLRYYLPAQVPFVLGQCGVKLPFHSTCKFSGSFEAPCVAHGVMLGEVRAVFGSRSERMPLKRRIGVRERRCKRFNRINAGICEPFPALR